MTFHSDLELLASQLPELLNDKQLVIKIIKSRPRELAGLPDLYRRDPELVRVAIDSYLAKVNQPLEEYELASKRNFNPGWVVDRGKLDYYQLIGNRDLTFIKKFLAQDGLALLFLEPDLAVKPELIKIALQQNGTAIKLVPSKLITKEMARLAAQYSIITCKYLPNSLKQDPEIDQIYRATQERHRLNFEREMSWRLKDLGDIFRGSGN